MNTPVGPDLSDSLAVEAGFGGSFVESGEELNFRGSWIGVLVFMNFNLLAFSGSLLSRLADGLNTDASLAVDDLAKKARLSPEI